MAYSTQTHFLRIRFPNEMSTPLPDNSGFTIKSYDSCCDIRSWSLNKAERAQYLLEFLSAKEHPAIKKPAEDVSHPDHPDNLKALLDAKQREVDELKKMMKELQDKIALLACQLENSQCCRAEVDSLQKLYDENIEEIQTLQCEINEEKAQVVSLTAENKCLNAKFCETCTQANEEYEELLKKYNEVDCQLQTELTRTKCQESVCEENDELKQNLKESCKKINLLNADLANLRKQTNHIQKTACAKSKEVNKLKDKLTQLQCELEQTTDEKCALQNQVKNNDHIGIAEAQICQLTKENEELHQQLQAYCDGNTPCEHDSGNESEQALQEAYENVKSERDCLQQKFAELQPDLEELATVVEDYADLECNYNELSKELADYKERQSSLVDRLKMLLGMESEFRQLQKRVSESERLLTEYQVLQKLECLRAGHNENENQVAYSQQNSTAEECSENYDSSDSTVCDPEQIPNLEITYVPSKKRCSNK